MDIGIFSKVFNKYSLDTAFSKISEFGISSVQFNYSNIGLDSLPSEVSDTDIKAVIEAKEKHKIKIPVVSGTFNTLELDEEKHERNMANFEVAVEAASKIGIPHISISTGSFNQEDFWSAHPDNHTEKGWERLFKSLDQMLEVAEKHDVIIIFEPEQANVVSTVEHSLKLLNHYDSPYLKVLYDPANMIDTSDAGDLYTKIETSIDALKEYIVAAHCKDLIVSPEEIVFKSVGKGHLPFDKYLAKLSNVYNGSVIMHGLDEDDVQFALDYLNSDKENINE